MSCGRGAGQIVSAQTFLRSSCPGVMESAGRRWRMHGEEFRGAHCHAAAGSGQSWGEPEPCEGCRSLGQTCPKCVGPCGAICPLCAHQGTTSSHVPVGHSPGAAPGHPEPERRSCGPTRGPRGSKVGSSPGGSRSDIRGQESVLLQGSKTGKFGSRGLGKALETQQQSRQLLGSTWEGSNTYLQRNAEGNVQPEQPRPVAPPPRAAATANT